MKDEIKEILDELKRSVNEDDWFEIDEINGKRLLDYITNLQEELERYQHYSKTTGIEELMAENERLKQLCNKYEEEHSTTFNEWKETITNKYQTLKDLQEEKDKYKNVIDKIKKYVKENTRYYDDELGLVEIMGAGATRIPVVYLYGLLELLEEVE